VFIGPAGVTGNAATTRLKVVARVVGKLALQTGGLRATSVWRIEASKHPAATSGVRRNSLAGAACDGDDATHNAEVSPRRGGNTTRREPK